MSENIEHVCRCEPRCESVDLCADPKKVVEAFMVSREQLQAAFLGAAARAGHVAVRAYMFAAGQEDVKPPWNDLPVENRVQIVRAVQMMVQYPNLEPAQAHAIWVSERRKQGWALGPKNQDAKTSPHICAYEDLSEYRKTSDAIFRAVVFAVMSTQEIEETEP
jgi:hypothetical protein